MSSLVSVLYRMKKRSVRTFDKYIKTKDKHSTGFSRAKTFPCARQSIISVPSDLSVNRY